MNPHLPLISLIICSDVWAQGDFVMIDDQTKQLIFLGRSDGILNPSGVRFGSSEIYNLIESQFKAEIAESICVGQRRPTDTDERVFLFIQLRSGVKFSLDLVSRVKAAIRKGLSPRHVPSFIFPTPEIPVCSQPFVHGKLQPNLILLC